MSIPQMVAILAPMLVTFFLLSSVFRWSRTMMAIKTRELDILEKKNGVMKEEIERIERLEAQLIFLLSRQNEIVHKLADVKQQELNTQVANRLKGLPLDAEQKKDRTTKREQMMKVMLNMDQPLMNRNGNINIDHYRKVLDGMVKAEAEGNNS